MVEILGKDYENLDYIYNFVPVLNNSLNLEKKNIIIYGGRLSKDKRVFESEKFLLEFRNFCFKAGVFLEELKRYDFELYRKTIITFDSNYNAFLSLD